MAGIIERLTTRKCPYCQSNRLRRSHRKNLGEVALSYVGIYPFRCENCYGRFRKPYGRLSDIISLVIKLVG
jgi:hypothetical protein